MKQMRRFSETPNGSAHCCPHTLFDACLARWSHPSSADTSSADIQEGTAYGAGMEAASAAATTLYFPFKAAFAIAGGIVGGLAYVFSGFSEPTAKNIWIPSTFGTYVSTPERLTGARPVRFLGVATEREGDASPAARHD